MGIIFEGSVVDVEVVVVVVCVVFDDWVVMFVVKCVEYIQKIVDGLQVCSEELVQLIVGEVGMLIKLVCVIQVGGFVYNWGNFVKLFSMFEFEEYVGNLLVVCELVGVVGVIMLWNYLFNQIMLKVVFVLVVGCMVVFKLLEVVLFNVFVLVEVIEEVGLLLGVFNFVIGYGLVVGEVLVSDLDVDMVLFMGLMCVGKCVVELVLQLVKCVVLELGGKLVLVILDDVDLVLVVKGMLLVCFLNFG